MDIEAIWLAVKTNLAPVSVFSMGGVLAYLYRRFNKRHRFRCLRADAREVMAGFSRFQHHWHPPSRRTAKKLPTQPPETLDILVEMLHQLQDRLNPLGVYLFRAEEISTQWILCSDRPTENGDTFLELAGERLREVGMALRTVSRLMNTGRLSDARKLFPNDYGGERRTNRASIVDEREEQLRSMLAAHGHDPDV